MKIKLATKMKLHKVRHASQAVPNAAAFERKIDFPIRLFYRDDCECYKIIAVG